MKLGRETLILVGVPLLLLLGAHLLLYPSGHGDPHRPAVRVAHEVPAETALEGPARSRPESIPWTELTPARPSVVKVADVARAAERREDAMPPRTPADTASEPFISDEPVPGEPRNEGRTRTGKVTDPSGRPVTKATIVVRERLNLFDKKGRSIGQDEQVPVTFDASGEFRFNEIHGRTYEIEVTPEDQELAPLKKRVAGAQPVSLVVARVGRVSGTIRCRSDARGIDGATVQLNSGSHGMRSVRTDPAGRFEFNRVVPGPVIVEVSHPDFVSERVRIPHVPDGGSVQKDFDLTGGNTLRGTVVLRGTESGVAGIEVAAFDVFRWLPAGRTRTDALGGFEFHSLIGGSTIRLTVLDEARGNPATTVVVPRSGTPVVARIEVDEPWKIDGWIRSVGGDPIAHARIEVRDSDLDGALANDVIVAYSDAQGYFVVENLGFGRSYDVVAWHPEFVMVGAPHVSLSDEGVTTLQFALPLGGVLTGLITDAGGNPVSGALVRVSSTAVLGGMRPEPVYTYTGEDGRYELVNVPPGEVTVLGLASGFGEQRTQASVEVGGEPAVVDLMLEIPNGQDH